MMVEKFNLSSLTNSDDLPRLAGPPGGMPARSFQATSV